MTRPNFGLEPLGYHQKYHFDQILKLISADMFENRRKSHLHIFGAKCHKQDAKLRGSGWSGVVRDTLPHNKKCEGFQISHFLILSYALLFICMLETGGPKKLAL